MSVQELETAVTQLPSPELARFAAWLRSIKPICGTNRVSQDAVSGRLDALAEQANREFEAGNRSK